MQQSFPGLKVEGGPYTPPVGVQYAIRAVRVAQAGVALGYFFGAQIFGAMGRPAPEPLQRMQDNPLIAVGVGYGLDVIAQTLHSINAFEITWNGHVLHSKLKSGSFPQPAELVARLAALKQQEESLATPASDTPQ